MAQENPSFISLEPNIDERLDDGFYPIQTTSERRYTDEESVDYLVYESLSRILSDRSGEYNILDIGSSSGEALDNLTKKLSQETNCRFNELALDPSNEMSRKCYEDQDQSSFRAMGQKLPFETNSIDLVVSSQLHLNSDDIDRVVEEINRVLDPSGYAVLSSGYNSRTNYQGIHRDESIPTENLPETQFNRQ
ncbi:class I SAM-dependent methyltransferase [Candidatus Nanohalobium constans]|uniref:SAM-dependent methyltransferase n=1 Tax=Candidatus Nanohalobium constans TaxID=2565781 RepID=A0A5Q0UEL3_9ARCH|nr:class I SAM-dependent methyltransferase [Candidatus Nanohalobium constans]QGA79968.1 SAM-dependent methyltransferase [Candidatus Nanohalobium constans]